ncbi:hypothetical protein D3C75_597460 [compost metagenome]
MVDTVNLAFLKILTNLVVDFLRSRKRSAQWFFHHDTRRFSIQLRLAQTFTDCAKGIRRHRKVVNGDAILLIEHLTEFGKSGSVVDIQIAKIQTAAQLVPQAFVDLFLHEGFNRFAHNFGISLFIPLSAAHTQDACIRVDLPRFF